MKDQILIKGMMAEGTKVLPRQYSVTRYYMNTMTRHYMTCKAYALQKAQLSAAPFTARPIARLWLCMTASMKALLVTKGREVRPSMRHLTALDKSCLKILG